MKIGGLCRVNLKAVPENAVELRCRLLAGNEEYFDIVVPVNDPYRWVKILSKGMP